MKRYHIMVDEPNNTNNSGESHDPEMTLKSSAVPEAPAPIDYQARPQNANVTASRAGATVSSMNGVAPQPIYVPRVSKTPPPPPPLSRESAARERVRRRRATGRRPGGEWAWVIIAGALFSVVVIMSVSIYFLLRLSTDKAEILPTAVADLSQLPTPVSIRSDNNEIVSGQPITLDNGYSLILEPWDGESRLTLLFMGLDRRPGETGLAYRTDTMMLISIDPKSDSIGILSIPRDLWVEVPGYNSLQRINTPMSLGEGRTPGLGPQLAMQTVQYNLGIRVQEYVAVDFAAVVGLVDAIGGITVTTDYPINDPYYPDMNYGYDPFYLSAGTHTLNGLNALKFARTRHGDSDIDRAQRQQQVLYAIRDQILDLNQLPKLIIQAPSLLGNFDDNVYTGLSMDQMIRLAWYVKDIPRQNIRAGTIDFSYTSPWTTVDGQQVLIPNRGRLGDLMVEIFGANYSE
jgi:LCP family protein required for cell wall assembly